MVFSPLLLALMLALLEATAGDADENHRVGLIKCCGEYQMLTAKGDNCVQAPWAHNDSSKRRGFFPPLDSKWMERWLPPGLPLQNIAFVWFVYNYGRVFSVNESSLWNSSFIENERLWRNTITFHGKNSIARPRPGGGFREASYCVDAALLPLGPFAVQFRTRCTEDECAKRCCPHGTLMKETHRFWECIGDAEGYWEPKKSSLALDPEFPTETIEMSHDLHLSPWNVSNAHHALHDRGIMQFHFSTWNTCFDFYRSTDGSLHEGLFYEQYPRVARGIYWLLRPLCILSALLLLASLVSIGCNKRIRWKIHGWCLASHSACLLGFNVGQIWYYLTISDLVNNSDQEYLPRDHQIVCKNVALLMYFLLMAAWVWLTALCINMAMGFSIQVTRPKRKSGKRFLALSAFAWGLPALMTTCSSLFTHRFRKVDPQWYNPSLAETRVCYSEFFVILTSSENTKKDNIYSLSYGILKPGTALYFYGPVCCLVMCNVITLALALRKIQYLKRGNSVLRREEDQILLGQSQLGAENPPAMHSSAGDGTKSRSGSTVDSKTIKIYIKMILMTGAIELLSEIIAWSITVLKYKDTYSKLDMGLPYRAVGYVTDFFRAAIVTWLAAPEGGYLGLVRRLRRGKGEKKNVA